MKTAISVPDEIFNGVERHAGRLGMSRSEFFATAAARYITELDDEDLVDAINAALSHAGSSSDEDFVRRAAQDVLAADDDPTG